MSTKAPAVVLLALPAYFHLIASATAILTPQQETCDRLTSHPSDPSRRTTGVDPNNVRKIDALRECRLAAEQNPEDKTTIFQYGRSLELSGKSDEALKVYNLAWSQGHNLAAARGLGVVWSNAHLISLESVFIELTDQTVSKSPTSAYYAGTVAYDFKKFRTAARYWKICAEIEHPDCLAEYGRLLFVGEGVAYKNEFLGSKFISRSIALGSDTVKQYRMEIMRLNMRDALRDMFSSGAGNNELSGNGGLSKRLRDLEDKAADGIR